MKKYHKNEKLNKVLNQLAEKAKTQKKGFSKEQKKKFVENIVKNSSSGFTLTELIIILGIVAALALFFLFK